MSDGCAYSLGVSGPRSTSISNPFLQEHRPPLLLPDDSSEAESDVDGVSFRKHSTDSAIQLEPPESSVYRAPVLRWVGLIRPWWIRSAWVGCRKYKLFDAVRHFYL